MIGKATTLNAAGILALCIGILAVLFLPRRRVAVAFVVFACFTTIGQQLVIANFSLTIVRMLIAATFFRVALRNETALGNPTLFDKVFVTWAVLGTLIPLLRLQAIGDLVGRLGFLYDAIGLYFVFRYSIKEPDDLHVVIRALAISIAVLTVLMSVEKIAGLNPFSIFGGVPEHTMAREGYLRAQGPFRHPILAGTLGSTSIPLFVSIWYGQRSRDRLFAVLGIVSSLAVVALTASSSPLITSAAALLSVLLWPFRKKARSLWYLFLMGLIALQAVMKAPVWYLFARASNVLGGTGWHRAFLIDQAVRYVGEWWFAGTSYTAHWMPYQLALYPNMSDITNQFVMQAVSGGIVTLCAFVIMIAVAFRTLAGASRTVTGDSWVARIIWAMWGSLLAHVVTFFSLSYFDQINVFWYLLLAGISLVLEKSAFVRPPASNRSLLVPVR